MVIATLRRVLDEVVNGPNYGARGERIFEKLGPEIRTKHPEDGIVVIDTEDQSWCYVPTLAEAEKAARKMKHPEATYYRPCYTP